MNDPNYGNYKDFKKLLINKKIIEWDEGKLILEDGTEVTIEMSESDCCAIAGGEFSNVKLDDLITNVSEPQISSIEDHYGVGNNAVVTIFHNQNPIAVANCYAEHNGYYYCIASFVIKNIHYQVVDA